MNADFLVYNALDSACTIECHNNFWPDLQPHGFMPAYDMTIALLPALMFMQTRGIKVNHTELEITKRDVLKSAAEKQDELNKLCREILLVRSSTKDCL